MTARVKLSELVAARAIESHTWIGSEHQVLLSEDAVVATLDAADVLIKAVRAELELIEAIKTRNGIEPRHFRNGPEFCEAARIADDEVHAAVDRRDAALAKVSL